MVARSQSLLERMSFSRWHGEAYLAVVDLLRLAGTFCSEDNRASPAMHNGTFAHGLFYSIARHRNRPRCHVHSYLPSPFPLHFYSRLVYRLVEVLGVT